MEAHQASVAAPMPSNGSHLAERALEAPEHGAGYFFAATAEGTVLILGSLAVVLGLLSVGNAHWIPAAASGIVTPVALSVGAPGLMIGGLWNFRAGTSWAAHSEFCTGRSWSAPEPPATAYRIVDAHSQRGTQGRSSDTENS